LGHFVAPRPVSGPLSHASVRISEEEIADLSPRQARLAFMPVPLLDQQREIAAEVQARRKQARSLKEDAERVLAEAKAEVERMILGEE